MSLASDFDAKNSASICYKLYLECDSGFYDERCEKVCSEHCGGAENSCNHVNGTCDLGCDPGYKNETCNEGKWHTIERNIHRKSMYMFSLGLLSLYNR